MSPSSCCTSNVKLGGGRDAATLALPVEKDVGGNHDDCRCGSEDEPTVWRERFVDVVLDEVALVHV